MDTGPPPARAEVRPPPSPKCSGADSLQLEPLLPAACPRLAGACPWQKDWRVIRNSTSSLIASFLPIWEASAILSHPCCRLPEASREEPTESRARLAWRGPWRGLARSEGTAPRQAGEWPRTDVAETACLLSGPRVVLVQPLGSSCLPWGGACPPCPEQ